MLLVGIVLRPLELACKLVDLVWAKPRPAFVVGYDNRGLQVLEVGDIGLALRMLAEVDDLVVDTFGIEGVVRVSALAAVVE